MTIHNGTSLFTTGDPIEINLNSTETKFTFNASGFNNIFIKFTAEENFNSQPHFWAEFGLRPLNKTDDDDDNSINDDDDDRPTVVRIEYIPISK